jgi:hypothetical protein
MIHTRFHKTEGYFALLVIEQKLKRAQIKPSVPRVNSLLMKYLQETF